MSLDGRLDVAVDPGAVSFEFAVTNAGTDPVEFAFPSAKTADVAVYEDADGDGEVWRWSEGRMFAQAARSRTLAPGDSLEETMTWSGPRRGEYTAEATLAATGVELVERVAFTV